LNQQIEKLLSIPQVAIGFRLIGKYGMKFTRSCQREQNIGFDRLLLKDKKAVVIDFKNRKPKKDDQKQIGEYCSMLNQMGFSSEKVI